jgi:hypothetical protein
VVKKENLRESAKSAGEKKSVKICGEKRKSARICEICGRKKNLRNLREKKDF